DVVRPRAGGDEQQGQEARHGKIRNRSEGSDPSGIEPTIDLDFRSRNSYHHGMKTTVSEKGQVTIPKAVRDKLGLLPGTEIDFEAIGGRLVGRKAVTEDAF